MIKISKIEVQKNHKDRVNIFVDDEYFASMYLDTAVKYGIKPGIEIEEESFKRYITESEQNIAFSKAFKYMDTALKTKKQMRDYLKKKGYDSVVIDNVIKKLEEYNYINDRAFAESYISTYKNKYGKNMLKSKLIEKGVSKENIEAVLVDYELEESVIDKLLIKKISNKPLTNDLLTKCIRFLSGRGFGFDEINSAIRKYKNKTKDDDYESWDWCVR